MATVAAASLTLAMALGGGITGLGSLWRASAGTHEGAPRPSAAVEQDPPRSGPEGAGFRELRHEPRVPAAPGRAAPPRIELSADPKLVPAPETASEQHTERPAAPQSPAAARTASGGRDDGRARRLEATALRLVNAERTKAGCEPLEVNALLHRAADGHSTDMAQRGYFSHTAPDGESPWERVKGAGYAKPASENIARGYDSAAAVVEAWMDSPAHRRNILDCGSRAVGIGVHIGEQGGPYWTQVFGYK